MATTTTLNGAVTAGAKQITLTAFTNPSSGGISAATILQFVTGEKCLVTDASLTPTLEVVRGYEGTEAAAHSTLEAVTYGLASDTYFTEANTYVGQHDVQRPSLYRVQTQEVTATGATGTTAANLTAGPMCFINTTGATDAGVNLWVPVAGDIAIIKNASTTGAVKIYSLGATINQVTGAVTGTTATSITITGNGSAMYACATAGVWQILFRT